MSDECTFACIAYEKRGHAESYMGVKPLGFTAVWWKYWRVWEPGKHAPDRQWAVRLAEQDKKNEERALSYSARFRVLAGND